MSWKRWLVVASSGLAVLSAGAPWQAVHAGAPSVTVGAVSEAEGTFFFPDISFDYSSFGESTCSHFVFEVTLDFGTGPYGLGMTHGGGTTCVVDKSDFSNFIEWPEEGSFTMSAIVTDLNTSVQASGSNTATFSEADSIAVNSFALNAVEGVSLSGTVSTFTDSFSTEDRLSDLVAVIDWGDSSTSAGTIVDNGGGNFSVNGSHTYAEEGAYAASVSVSDDSPGTAAGTATGTVNVADAALTPTGQTIQARPTVPFTATVASFVDADANGTASDYAATIDWGDTTALSGGAVSAAAGRFLVSGSHTYLSVGTYSVTVTIGDAGGSSTIAHSQVVVTSADLAVSIGATPNPVKTGNLLTYTITVKNGGPTAAGNVVVTNPLPAAAQFQSISAPGWLCLTPAVGATGTVTCTTSSLANGSSSTITIVVTIVAAGKTVVTNMVSVSSDTFDPNSANNSATVATNVFGRGK